MQMISKEKLKKQMLVGGVGILCACWTIEYLKARRKLEDLTQR